MMPEHIIADVFRRFRGVVAISMGKETGRALSLVIGRISPSCRFIHSHFDNPFYPYVITDFVDVPVVYEEGGSILINPFWRCSPEDIDELCEGWDYDGGIG